MYDNAFDIVENYNLWMWVFSDADTVHSYEYGLISQTFKAAGPSKTIARNHSFLNSLPNSAQQIFEFNRNVGFAPRSVVASGQGGTAMLYWAGGRQTGHPTTDETINALEFNGFNSTYTTRSSITRQWNWLNLNSTSVSYFVFGDVASRLPFTSYTDINKSSYDLSSLTSSSTPLIDINYFNGAGELQSNPTVYDSGGSSTYGDYSVYRGCWKGNSGYFARNDGVGPFFRLKNFYRTEGFSSEPFLNIRKLQDIQGATKLEGQMTNLSTGVYVLNNTGSVSKFDDTALVWSTGGPGVNSLLYRSLQDTSAIGFDDPRNTLLVTSDNDKRAYISFDYSENAFLVFSEIDLTFKLLSPRPAGNQWLMGIN